MEGHFVQMIEYYKSIWRATARHQMIIVLLSLSVAFLAAFPLHYQKVIINGLTEKTLDLPELQWLCLLMGGIIILSLTLKWVLGYLSSILGEDVIRSLRNRVSDLSHDPQDETGGVAFGVKANMVSAEAEQVGKFSGSAISLPIVQGGTLLAIVGYIMLNHQMLGWITLGMIFAQALVSVLAQRHVNELVSQRIYKLREATNRLVGGVGATEVARDFDRIYNIRARIFGWKLSSKFFVSLVNSAATVGVLMVGGWQVLEGKTDVGTVVAAMIGLGRLQGPTKELIAYYRQLSATAVKFDLLQRSGVHIAPTPGAT